MAKYRITDPQTGKVVTVSGEKPPTQADAEAIFQSAGLRQSTTGLQNITNFLGLKNVSKGFQSAGTGLAELLSPDVKASKEAQQRAEQAVARTSQASAQATDPKIKALLTRSALSGSENLSNIAQQQATGFQENAGITDKEIGMSPQEFATRRGVGTAAEIGSYLLPSTIIGKGATAGARIGTAATKGAVAGGLQGLAGATETADTLGETALQTGLGAVVGAGTGAALQGVVEGGVALKNLLEGSKGTIKQKLVDSYKSTLKSNIKDQKFYKQYGGEDKVVKDAIKYQAPATKQGLEKQLNEYGPEYGKIIEKEASNLQKQGKRVNLAQAFKRAKKTVIDRFSHDSTLEKQANSWFDSNASKYKNTTNALPKTANELRKKFDRKVGEILTADAAPSDAARKAFASELRNEFKKIASQETKDAIQKYQLFSGLAEAMQKEPKIGITEATYAALSPGTGLGNLLELGIGKAIRSPGLRRTVATQGIKNIGLPKISQATIKPVENIVNPTMSAINRALENYNQKRQERKRL